MLTRIRNASAAKHDTVDIPASNMKKSIAQILLDEGYIKGFNVIDDKMQGIIRITLKYGEGKSQVICGLKRISKPGLRIYTSCKDCPKVMRGLGIAILSTPKGVMTDKSARKENVGGELLAYIW
jgi:small subunit ribosomal protein S8